MPKLASGHAAFETGRESDVSIFVKNVDDLLLGDIRRRIGRGGTSSQFLPWMIDSSIVEQHLDQPNGRARSCKRFRRAREALQIALTVPPVPGDVRPTRSCPVESSARPASTDGALWGSW